MVKLSFGCTLPIRGPCASVGNLSTAAKEQEALGFDAIYMNDHISSEWPKHLYDFQGIGPPEVPENFADPIVFESITSMAYLAAITERVEIAVSVILLPVRNPIVLAKQIATVDVFSRGRIVVGFGVGNKADRPEAENIGLAHPFEERGKVADESIMAMRIIWTESEPSFHGKYIKFDNLLIYPKPIRKPHPPIIIGGRSPAAERRAALLGDGYSPSFSGIPEFPGEISRIREIAKKRGRNISNNRFVGTFFTSIDESRESSRKALEYQLVIRGGGIYGGLHKKEHEDMLGREWSNSEHVERAMVGSPSDIIRKIESLLEIDGFTHLQLSIVHPTFASYMKQIRLLGREVLPSFK